MPNWSPPLILLYHHVAPVEKIPRGSRNTDHGWHFTHSPEAFESQLLELRRRGFDFISLPELVQQIRATGTEDKNSAVVTFDDGWIDNFEFAFPILKRLGIPATFFVTTEHLRNGSDPERMGCEQLQHLLKEGFSIGAHTRTHQDLTRIPEPSARDEIVGSKTDLEAALGVPVDFLAYPGGAFNSNVVRLTQDAGYQAACSVLGPKTNDAASIFWLYRDVLSPGLNTLGDRYRLSKSARKLFAFRVNRKLKHRLAVE